MSERLPGITDENLIRRVMMNLTMHRRARGHRARWVTVAIVFALGSTYAKQLCRDFGYDPEERLNG